MRNKPTIHPYIVQEFEPGVYTIVDNRPPDYAWVGITRDKEAAYRQIEPLNQAWREERDAKLQEGAEILRQLEARRAQTSLISRLLKSLKCAIGSLRRTLPPKT